MYVCVYIITTTHSYTHTQCYLLHYYSCVNVCMYMYVHRARQSLLLLLLLLLATIEFRLCFYIFYFSKYIIFRISILLAARSLSRVRAAE